MEHVSGQSMEIYSIICRLGGWCYKQFVLPDRYISLSAYLVPANAALCRYFSEIYKKETLVASFAGRPHDLQSLGNPVTDPSRQ